MGSTQSSMSHGFLSPLGHQLTALHQGELRGRRGGRGRKQLKSALVLTSLVDAFSILVIYLLFQTGSGLEQMKLADRLKLPKSTQAESLKDIPSMIRVDKGTYSVNQIPVPSIGSEQDAYGPLVQALKSAIAERSGSEGKVIIQADTTMDVKELTPILVAGSIAGVRSYQLATEKVKGP